MALGARLISLVSLSSLAVLICTLSVSPVTALSIEMNHNARSLHGASHDAVAKRKRSAKKTKRCRPKASLGSASASTPKSTPQPAPPPPPSSSDSNSNAGKASGALGSRKAALAWANGEQDLSQWQGLADTLYTWSPACPSNAESLGMKCCLMLWGFDQVDQFVKAVNAKTPNCVMGVNEPEIPGQSNMSPQDAATLWNEHIRPLKDKGTILVSPATTSDPRGLTWMQEFYNACGGNDDCGVDFHAAHWYDVGADKLIEYLENLHNTFRKDIWLTEFACQNFNGGPQCSMSEVWELQARMTVFFEQTDWMKKFMPFGAMHDMQGVNSDNQLMGSNGGPNALAHAYFG